VAWAGGSRTRANRVLTAAAPWPLPPSRVWNSGTGCGRRRCGRATWPGPAGQTHLARWVEGSTVAWPGGLRTPHPDGRQLDIAYLGAAPAPALGCLDLRIAAGDLANGHRLGMRQGMGQDTHLAPAGEPAAALKDTPAVMPSTASCSSRRRWLAQTVMISCAGPTGACRCGGGCSRVLLQLTEGAGPPRMLRAAETELPYPALKTWWRASKMLRSPAVCGRR